jgi:hypothetical protein
MDVAKSLGIEAADLTNEKLKEYCESQGEPDKIFGLKFAGCVQLTSLAGLERFTELKEINCEYCYALEDFSALASCKSLSKVNLYYCTGNTPTTDLEWYCEGHAMPTKVPNTDLLAPLQECKGLQELYLQNSLGINEETQQKLKDAVPGLAIKKTTLPASSWTALYAQ